LINLYIIDIFAGLTSFPTESYPSIFKPGKRRTPYRSFKLKLSKLNLSEYGKTKPIRAFSGF